MRNYFAKNIGLNWLRNKFFVFQFFLLFSLFGFKTIWSQQTQVQLLFKDTKEELKFDFPSPEEAMQAAKKQIPDLHVQGFITASVDSFFANDSLIRLYIFKGEQYLWKTLNIDSLPPEIHKQVSFFIQRNAKHGLDADLVKKLTDFLLINADENGYPFAQVFFDDVQIDSANNIAARLRYLPGKTYTIDSILYDYDGALKESFFLTYLNLHHGMKYSAKQLKTISPLIAALPYLEETKDWQLNLGVNQNKLHLFLKPKRTNQINAIVGLQPSSDPEKRFDITADVNLLIRNELGYGEKLKFTYQQLQAQSPKLEAAVMWPYLMGTNFGVDGGFEYQKFDSAFRKTKGTLGIWYHFAASDYIRLFTELQSNRTIAFDTNFVKSNKKLPPNIDVKSNGAGLNLAYNRLNNLFNPRKGWTVDISVLGAQRTVLPNNALDNLESSSGFDYSQLYDTMDLVQFQFRVKTEASYFIPIRHLFTLKLAYENAYISGKQLFRNELYTIGGFKLMRGFNEQSIFANHYQIGTIEPRLIVGQLSYIYLFSDFGYIQTLDFNNNPSSFKAFSFGLGGTVSTKSGVFNIAFGLGKQGNEKLELRNTRVHFGYSVYF